MANRRFNTQTTQPLKSGGRVKRMGGGMSTKRKDMASGYYKDDMGMKGGAMYKKGGSVKKKKQGYKDRKDESIACLLYTSPSPRDRQKSRMPSSA